jgi:predicted RNA-binding protein YlqC (UPF0109 family)
MREFLEYVARHLVDVPDAVAFQEEERDNRIVFTLSVDPRDIGKVIGKKGRTAQAMRTLLSAVAAREGKRAILEIND